MDGKVLFLDLGGVCLIINNLVSHRFVMCEFWYLCFIFQLKMCDMLK